MKDSANRPGWRTYWRNALVAGRTGDILRLTALAVGCALLLAWIDAITSDAIHENRTVHAWQAASDILGRPVRQNDSAWQNQTLRLATGVCLQRGEVEGYAGRVALLAGFDHAGELVGVRVTRHQETPGIGDFISLRHNLRTSAMQPISAGPAQTRGWLFRFEATPAAEVDAISGATITSNAVKRGIARLVAGFHEDAAKAGCRSHGALTPAANT